MTEGDEPRILGVRHPLPEAIATVEAMTEAYGGDVPPRLKALAKIALRRAAADEQMIFGDPAEPLRSRLLGHPEQKWWGSTPPR